MLETIVKRSKKTYSNILQKRFRHLPRPIHVCFTVLTRANWAAYASLFNALAKDERFFPYVFIIPCVDSLKKKRSHILVPLTLLKNAF